MNGDLWHYTCRHSARRLGRTGVLRPAHQPAFGNRGRALRVVWATDLEQPDRDALGLTSVLLKCDRTTDRYRILEPERFTRWNDWWPEWIDPGVASMLGYPPRQSARWWIATQPALAERVVIERRRSLP